MRITFEDAWNHRLPAPEELPQLLPDIEQATEQDRQVAVYAPEGMASRNVRDEPPASLDGLAAKPWVESVVLGWRAQASLPLPGVRSLVGMHMFSDVDADSLARLPSLEQLVQHDVLPETLAGLPNLRDAIFDWRSYDVPAGVNHLRLLARPEEREQYRRSTAGPAALSGLRSLERLRLHSFRLGEDVAPIAELTGLRWLSLHGWRNLRALGRLTELESLELLEVEMTNLRPFRGLHRLRELSLMGRLKSLDGIEALTALDDLWLRGRVVRDLEQLVGLPNLRRLALLWPDAVDDFSPLGRLGSLQYLELMVGNDSDTGRLPSIDFLAGLDRLEELRLFNVDISDGRLDALFELPNLRLVHLTGAAGPDAQELRRRRPELELEVHLVGEPEGRVYVGPVHYDPPFEGVEQWSIVQSLADLLGRETNSEAEGMVRDELRRRDPDLLRRLQFDSEAGSVGIHAASEADIRAVATLIVGLVD